MDIRKAVVTEIKWYVDAKGIMLPTVRLDKMVKTKNVSLDALAFGSVEPIIAKQLFKGKKIKLKISKNNVIVLDEKKDYSQQVKNNPLNLDIDKCPICDGIVEHYHCTNDLCQGKSVSKLYKLGLLFNSHPETVANYFNNFKLEMGSEPIPVETIFEYLVYAQNTLINTFDTNVEKYENPAIVKLESDIVKALGNSLSNRDFWSIMNFKNCHTAQLDKLENVDYTLITENNKEYVTALRSQFTEDFDNLPLLSDIIYAEQALKRIVKGLEKIKIGYSKRQNSPAL